MSIDALRQLVSRYAADQINYADFRHQFVSQFLSVRHADGLEQLANSVESMCSDYAEGFVGEPALKARIARVVLPAQVATISNYTLTKTTVFKQAQSSSTPADSITDAASASNAVESIELAMA